jgi:hypothetical protein
MGGRFLSDCLWKFLIVTAGVKNGFLKTLLRLLVIVFELQPMSTISHFE